MNQNSIAVQNDKLNIGPRINWIAKSLWQTMTGSQTGAEKDGTLFHADRTWPMPDFTDPFTGWDLLQVVNGAYTAGHTAKNYLYQTIRQALGKRDIRLKLLCLEAEKLPEYPDPSGRRRNVDRIEVTRLDKGDGDRIASHRKQVGPMIELLREQKKKLAKGVERWCQERGV
ncbi:uncharacterized protein N7515_005703 [Penicillium bovifimosum]|uniref:Uncharacterized protein n=1 Tax=Penicillium bovifimosum TaxID=126998 RepID=A0A9W9L039_9EURO|nr:uncharacterized protein N7515_005703 [Penicillium bovifimosum]KAJ5129664.1 hypothetical protein N7515_005703 [Penicillium bovifimosum]